MPSPAYIASAVNAEASSLWSRVVGYVTGRKDEYARLENGLATAMTTTTTAAERVQSEPRASVNTASAKFAHTSVEVGVLVFCMTSFLNFFFF